jgi:hypothetical protein
LKLTSQGTSTGYTIGNYYGYYYSDLTATSMKSGMANEGAPGYGTPAYTTLADAKTHFTATSISSWYGMPGTYSKQ